MRVLVVSDVHANLAALETVMQDAGEVDGVWCLGDTVGYGPQPNEVIGLLKEAYAVLGNHDAAAAGLMSVEGFNPIAAEAALWTAGELDDASLAWIGALQETLTVGEHFTLVHGSLREPVWEYLVTMDSAVAHLALQTTPYSIVGHSHLPMRVVEDEDGPRFTLLGAGDTVELGEGRLILNPGSVGQPRDGDPRASYGLLDSAEGVFTLRRVEYEVTATQKLMMEAGLPGRLIQRLSVGR